MKRIALVLIALLSLLVFVSAKRRAVGIRPAPSLELVSDRSMVVTEKEVLEPFTFLRVLDAITNGSGVTSEAFFRQWWDLQNEPHCTELLNGLPRRCPTDEGKLATAPFLPESFIPIGLINRFDQADATQCGQYRLIFANRTVTSEEAFHIIFEAELPNPKPELGLENCRPVAQYWADLSKVESPAGRRELLERFFFEGVHGFPPAVHADHFRNNQAGVRTLQLTLPNGFPSFYQFRIVREDGALKMKTDVLENLALFSLIDASTDKDDRAVRFRQMFIGQLKNLIHRDANLYFVEFPQEFLIPDAAPAQRQFLFPLNVGFNRSLQTPEGKAYEAEIAAELQRLGSTLEPAEVVVRAETQNCIGCHFTGVEVGDGVVFPPARDFASHVSEQGATATHFAISPAMRDVFVPHRMKILKDFLLHGTAPVHSN